MAKAPSGNIELRASVTAPGVFTTPPQEEDIESGFDLCGVQVVLDAVVFGADTVSVVVQLNMASAEDLPQPAWVDALNGSALLLAADGTTTLGDPGQLMRIGHARRVRALVSASGVGVIAGTAVVYLTSVGATVVQTQDT